MRQGDRGGRRTAFVAWSHGDWSELGSLGITNSPRPGVYIIVLYLLFDVGKRLYTELAQ